MDQHFCTTFVFDSEKLDEYGRGFISGLMYLLTGKPSDTFAWGRSVEDGKVLWSKTFEATDEQALAVRDEVEKVYPGVILEMI